MLSVLTRIAVYRASTAVGSSYCRHRGCWEDLAMNARRASAQVARRSNSIQHSHIHNSSWRYQGSIITRSSVSSTNTPRTVPLTTITQRWSSSITASTATRPVRRTNVSVEERARLRKARKEQAAQFMQQQQQQTGSATATKTAAVTSTQAGTSGAAATTMSNMSTASSQNSSSMTMAIYRMGWWFYVGGLGIPTGLLIWGWNDENSPPAKVAQWIGLSKLVHDFAFELSKPSHDKLLPDWADMPNVPHDIPIPHTLVLDLEQTLVGSTWDRKYGWRHAKRPGVDMFLHEMAQYYEIVLYSPSHEGLATPVVDALDKDGCIMHRLFRDATHFYKGVHVKDLKRLNRDIKRMIVLDDDPSEVQFNPQNLIRVKPYTDPTDRTDTTLTRITPFLIEIAREGYSDIPNLLQQYQGMDADEIADEQERRLNKIKEQRSKIRQRGLGYFVPQTGALKTLTEQAPEFAPAAAATSYAPTSYKTPQLTAKDIAGASVSAIGAGAGGEDAAGLLGFIRRRAKEREEHQMRKMEKWTEVMMKKQKEQQQQHERA